MNNEHLTAAQIRALVERAGTGKNLSANVVQLADTLGISVPQMWRYLRDGLPSRMNRRTRRELLALATQLGVIETAEAEGGRFL